MPTRMPDWSALASQNERLVDIPALTDRPGPEDSTQLGPAVRSGDGRRGKPERRPRWRKRSVSRAA